MILGIGVDLCAISRMQGHVGEGRFLQRYCTGQEAEYILGRGPNAAQSLASCFAAKEAFAKALGSGVDGFSLSEVEVVHDEVGAPSYVLHGRALEAAHRLGVKRMWLSLSHEGDMAAAFAVLEGD